jgi:hypothetical protein
MKIKPLVALSCALLAACWLDPRHRAVERTVDDWLEAVAREDSVGAARLSTGEQPWRAAEYIRWLRPDFLAAAAQEPDVGWTPSFKRRRALLSVTVPCRGDIERLRFALAREKDEWVVSRVDIEFEDSRPDDPENQPDFAEVRMRHGFDAVRRH